jgi:hypothetical protein
MASKRTIAAPPAAAATRPIALMKSSNLVENLFSFCVSEQTQNLVSCDTDRNRDEKETGLMSAAAFPATSELTSSDWSAIFSAYVSGWATRLRPKRPPRLEGTGATGAGTVVVDAAPDGPWVVSFDDRGVFSDDIALTVEGRGTKAPLVRAASTCTIAVRRDHSYG